MKNGLTELVFILDKSGSMGGLESDTIGGFNSMLAKQQAESGECRITTVLFNNDYELLHDRLDIQEAALLTERDYQVGGSTALLDAIGKTIYKIANVQRNIADEHRAEKVLFVITTDGEENSSHEYSYVKIKTQIERQKVKYGWEFIFLGANIDALEVAGQIGISVDRAQNFHADDDGTAILYEELNKVIVKVRSVKSFDANWKDKIETDHKSRKSKR